MTAAQLLLLLSVPIGGALAVWVLWLNRSVSVRATEIPDSAYMRADV